MNLLTNAIKFCAIKIYDINILPFTESQPCVIAVLVQRVPHNKGELKTDQSQMDVKIDVISATLKMKTSQRNRYSVHIIIRIKKLLQFVRI